MNGSSSSVSPRLSEAGGILLLILGLVIWLSLLSYHPEDPSWNTASGGARPRNLIGPAGSYGADLCLQAFGVIAFLLPVFVVLLAWRWVRSRTLEAPLARMLGGLLLVLSGCTVMALGPDWGLFGGAISAGGLIGMLSAHYLLAAFNLTGAVLVTGACLLVSLYLATR